MKKDLAIAMPVYNEADGIKETLKDLVVAFNEASISIMFVIQNDASSDKTLDVLESLKNEIGIDIQIENNRSNLGHGPTTLRAYKRAVEMDSPVVLQLDSDGQFIVSEIVGLYAAIVEGYDVAIGVRRKRTDPFSGK